MAHSVSSSRILDRLADACARWRYSASIGRTGPDGALDVFFSMSDSERLAFDLFLVSMDDELAHQAGTCEHRFIERVRRMVSATGETSR